MAGRCSGLCIHLPSSWAIGRDRALAFGQRCTRVVLFQDADPGPHRPPNGLLPDHADDGGAPRAQHGLLRSTVSEPGHHATRGLWQFDSPAVAAWAETTGKFGNPDEIS